MSVKYSFMVVVVVAILLISSAWFSTPKAFKCTDCEQASNITD